MVKDWICEECKGKDIQIKAWVCANTDQVIEYGEDDSDIWCADCSEHTKLIEEEKE